MSDLSPIDSLKGTLRTMMSTTYYMPVETVVGSLFLAFRGVLGMLKMISFDDEVTFKQNFARIFHQEPALEADPPETLLRHVQEAVCLHKPFPGHYDISQLSPLQQHVLMQTRAIPIGNVRTYTEIAQNIGRPDQAAEIEEILQQNPLPIIFPCHRAIGDDGRLGSYVGGKTAIKHRLLTLEKADELGTK